MRSEKHTMIVVGARPNFVKAAPLMYLLKGDPRFRATLVHTGQHYDVEMSDVFFRDLNLPKPDINLEVGSGTHARQTAQIMMKFEAVCEIDRPDWVVVMGDVNSTMSCSLVASKMGIRVAHIEAGLRSFDRTMPEEVNRVVTDALANLLLTHSPDADENLAREGIAQEAVHRVGNIMIDALVAHLDRAREKRLLHRLHLAEKEFAYVTLHRPSNVDNEHVLRLIVHELEELSRSLPVVFPLHPRTRERCKQFNIALPQRSGVHILAPIGYHDSICLAEHARLVITDSGGLQEETTFFRTPCLTLRPNTERPITFSVGSNRLTTIEQLKNDIKNVLAGPHRLGSVPEFWDGKTAKRIVPFLI